MNPALALSLIAAMGTEPELQGLSPQAVAEYEQKYLSVADELTVSGGDSSRIVRIYQGKYLKRIGEDDFYRLVGQTERADWINRRHRLQAGLFIGGLAATAVGVITSISAMNDGCERDIRDPLFGECVEMNAARIRNGPPVVGTVLFFGGIGVAFSSLFFTPRPDPPEEMRRLADEHNRALRSRLTGAPARAERPRALQLQTLPYATSSGGGLLLRGAF
jgi:hypothetical protein